MRYPFINLFLFLILAISCGSANDARTEAYKTAYNGLAAEGLERAEMDYTQKKDVFDDQKVDKALALGQQIEQKLIKTGDISLLVEDYKAARTKVLAAIKAQQGYVALDNEENSSYRTGTVMTVRVPKANFDTLVSSIIAVAQRVETKNISLQDVTEEFVDIQARLRNKREVEKRYVDILTQAKTIKDILEVEEHLRQLREEIEAKEGRLKYLQSQVSYSTVHLEMYQKYTQSVYRPSFWSKLGDATVGGFRGFQSFVIGLVYIWPFLIIFALIFWWLRKLYLRSKQNKA